MLNNLFAKYPKNRIPRKGYKGRKSEKPRKRKGKQKDKRPRKRKTAKQRRECAEFTNRQNWKWNKEQRLHENWPSANPKQTQEKQHNVSSPFRVHPRPKPWTIENRPLNDQYGGSSSSNARDQTSPISGKSSGGYKGGNFNPNYRAGKKTGKGGK